MHRILCSLAVILVSAAVAEEFPKLPAVERGIHEAIEAHEIAGAVTLFWEDGQIRHLAADGLADIAAADPMRTTDLFWIASMSKPVTAAAVMMMQDEGKLSIDDPVSKYLPEFADLKNAAGDPAVITIAQCLGHTSGLADLSKGEEPAAADLAAVARIAAGKPLNFDPGTKWSYCQSGINSAARIVEVVSGKSFPEFLSERMFGPLGMVDTTFYPTLAQAERLATSYRRSDDGKLEPAEIFVLLGKAATDRCPLANGGLFSTATDYLKFCQMLLNDGELDGRRYLSAAAVERMRTIQTGDLVTGFSPGNGWGIGCCVVREPQEVSAALSPGSFGHGGAYGTQAWIDPTKKRIFILMVQRANFGNSDRSSVREGFQNAAVGR